MNYNEIYTVEYSASQNCFHVDTLEKVILMNRANCRSRNSVDYQIIALCDSYEQAMENCRKFKRLLKSTSRHHERLSSWQRVQTRPDFHLYIAELEEKHREFLRSITA